MTVLFVTGSLAWTAAMLLLHPLATSEFTVNNGTSQDLIRKSVLPAIEKTLAEKSAPLRIPGFAPAKTDTSKFLDIVDIDLDPVDVTGGGRCNKKPICCTIKCKTNIYVKSTSNGVVSNYLLVTASLLQNLMTGTSADQVIVFLDNFKSQTDLSYVGSNNAIRKEFRDSVRNCFDVEFLGPSQ
jgi:hypothetical protein